MAYFRFCDFKCFLSNTIKLPADRLYDCRFEGEVRKDGKDEKRLLLVNVFRKYIW